MDRVKELQDEGMDFASAMAQAMKEDMAQNKARGGIMDAMDVNMQEQIDTPSGDMTMDVNSMESIKGQTAGPDWYMDRLQHLEFLGYNYETAGEIAYDTDRYMNVIEMDIAPGPGEGDDDYATGGRVGKNQGGLMSMGGNEMDLRGGGFVPMGKAERADDVPARLSKNEFVMTADAVRAAGGGSVQKGADLMYDQMKQLEGQA